MNDEYVIETQRLSKRYGRLEAVADLDLKVRGGRISGFLGRNGAGKSTTIKMLLGMVHPTSGTGRVLGWRIDSPRESVLLRREVAYVGEDKGLYPYMTVAQLVRFTRSFYDDWRPEVEQRLLREYQLPLDRKVKALSKGMRTKLALMLALARRPSLLILDEPTEGLDPVSIEELLGTLRDVAACGTAVFFSSHQLAEVERIASHILIIDRGRLVLDLALDRLQETYRRITMSFDTEPAKAAFSIPGVERIRVEGRRLVVLTSGNADAVDAVVERARRLHADSVEVSPVTLREVFLDTVEGGR